MRLLTRFPAALVVALSLTAPIPSFAQILTGEIHGRVTDASGAVLPGATITVEGPALIQPEVSVSTETGAYSFPRLPVGVYSIRFELAGFRPTLQQEVRIQSGFSAQINVKLELSTVQETDDRERSLADRRHQADDHRRDLYDRGAAGHSHRARSVGAARADPRRRDEPAERRRQQVGPAVDVHGARHAAGQFDLERRRRHHHRHGRHRLFVGLLRLRLVPGDQLHHRRRGCVGADRRREPELHHPQRRQRHARLGPLLRLGQQLSVEQHHAGAAGTGRGLRQPAQEHPRLRRRGRRSDRQEQGVVLGRVRQAGHRSRRDWLPQAGRDRPAQSRQPRDRSHGARELQPQAERRSRGSRTASRFSTPSATSSATRAARAPSIRPRPRSGRAARRRSTRPGISG